MKNVKQDLKRRCGECYNNVQKETEKWEKIAESRVLTEGEREGWVEARKKWLEAERKKMEIAKQKAKIKWMREGTKTQDFFTRQPEIEKGRTTYGGRTSTRYGRKN